MQEPRARFDGGRRGIRAFLKLGGGRAIRRTGAVICSSGSETLRPSLHNSPIHVPRTLISEIRIRALARLSPHPILHLLSFSHPPTHPPPHRPWPRLWILARRWTTRWAPCSWESSSARFCTGSVCCRCCSTSPDMSGTQGG
ncbi:unnamed protein product [Mycena citricolor]|uniref:Uncharacterized protein n=1 Tax=Mycena citricolor TaxID=2018698 RepID=A0AAD2HX79_9AGAR|nr:unnamed protein product [Mycena citricolor]